MLADLTDISRQLYVETDCRFRFISAMRSAGRIVDFESQIYRRDGSIIWISENAHAVRDERIDELLYYEGMVQEITHRIKTRCTPVCDLTLKTLALGFHLKLKENFFKHLAKLENQLIL